LALSARREELLELGLELFSTRPYDEVSLEDIAAAAGISKGLVYHYFPSKRDLYVATLRVASERLLAVTEPDPTLPKPMRLFRGLAAYLDYVEGYAQSYTALLKGGVGSDVDAASIVEHSRQVIMQRVLAALGVSVVDVPPALHLVLRGWIGFVEATSTEWLESKRLSKEQLLEMMVSTLAVMLPVAQGIDPSIHLDIE
jgi:AcrR family transcriptional regulator